MKIEIIPKLAKTCSSRDYKKTQKKLILDSFSKKVIENTKKLDNHKNTIRLIDGNNNLIVFKGDISQPFKSIDDITCQLFVNHKELENTTEIYKEIINNLKGTCIILNN